MPIYVLLISIKVICFYCNDKVSYDDLFLLINCRAYLKYLFQHD